MANQCVADIFGHLHAHAGVVESHQLRRGRYVQAQQGIHARADIEGDFELRLLIKKGLRWLPHDGVVGGRGARLPQADVGAGQGGAQVVQPGLGVGGSATKGNLHGVSLKWP